MIRSPAPESDTTIASAPWRRIPWKAAGASLALHAVLAVFVLSMKPDERDPPIDRGSLALRLVAVDAAKPRDESTQGPVHRPEPYGPSEEPPAMRPPSGAESPVPAVAPAGTSRPRNGVFESPSRSGIAARIIEQIRSQSPDRSPDAMRSLPWTRSGERVSGLPGVRGWLSGHVGAVRARSDRWRAGDGAARARHVLADGTVVCTRRRSPTIDEAMNPWKSLAVTMAWNCGRQRPEAPDYDDPRVQPPPGYAVEP